MIIVFSVVALLFIFIWFQAGYDMSAAAIMIVVLFLIVSFSSLSVSIDDQYLRIKFGYGIFKKKFQLKEIASAKSVRNPWYFGWGIRFWYWPSFMVIFNVSGYDAVELKMKNGRTYRIGTDQPKELESALNRELSHD